MSLKKVYEILKDYDNFLKEERNQSEKTRTAYDADLNDFIIYLLKKYNQEPTIDLITEKDREDYFSQLQSDQSYNSNTLLRAKSSIRQFYDFIDAEKCLKEYDTYIKVERNLSEKTRTAYSFDLKKLMIYLKNKNGKVPSIDLISVKEIKDYLSHLHSDRHYKSNTLSRTISSIRKFFDFAISQDYLEKSPAGNIKNPKLSQKLPIYLVDSELKKLLLTPDISTEMGIRDRTILICLAFTGMRLSEIVGLSLDDVSFEQKALKVMGKGAKERLTPMNQIVCDAISDYLSVRPISEDTAVFLNRSKKRFTGRGIENVVKKYVLMSGIAGSGNKISPHKLRHTFATLLHMKDVDIIEIQNLLGHASIASTQIYTHTNSKRLKSAVDKLVE